MDNQRPSPSLLPRLVLDEPWASGQRKRYLATLDPGVVADRCAPVSQGTPPGDGPSGVAEALRAG